MLPRPIAGGMKIRAAMVLSGVVFLAACQKKEEIVVTETRGLTPKDQKPKLFATSDERFKNAQPSPVEGTPPENWLAMPASQFRLLNYRFGESGFGEVWVSLSSGTVLDNTNRWLQQFSVAPLDAAGFAKMRRISIVGTQGVWVEASGDYDAGMAGMGAPPKPGYGLAGVITEANGQILTVKMVGPKAEVEKERAALEAYIQTLRLVAHYSP
ncbi:MAG: hypothetical protein QM627_05535 [Luteolibacter sp.]